MCIENTLLDIANESSLDSIEKQSLKLIAKKIKNLKAENKKLKEKLRKWSNQ